MKNTVFIGLLWAVSLSGAERQARTLQMDSHSIAELRCQVKVSTVIVLPSGEKILDFVVGDKDFWPIGGQENMAYVKPAKAGSSTNLQLITSTGNVYSFILQEVSRPVGAVVPPVEVDYKVFIEPIGDAVKPVAQAPRFVSADELADSQKEVKRLQDEVQKTEKESQARAQERIEKFQSEYPNQLIFDYKFNPKDSTFKVTSIFHDDKFTYLKSDAKEAPALYEVKDDKESLVQYQIENGTYIVPKIIDRGRLSVGKKKYEFWRVIE